jgi:hypothetical protein
VPICGRRTPGHHLCLAAAAAGLGWACDGSGTGTGPGCGGCETGGCETGSGAADPAVSAPWHSCLTAVAFLFFFPPRLVRFLPCSGLPSSSGGCPSRVWPSRPVSITGSCCESGWVLRLGGGGGGGALGFHVPQLLLWEPPAPSLPASRVFHSCPPCFCQPPCFPPLRFVRHSAHSCWDHVCFVCCLPPTAGAAAGAEAVAAAAPPAVLLAAPLRVFCQSAHSCCDHFCFVCGCLPPTAGAAAGAVATVAAALGAAR